MHAALIHSVGERKRRPRCVELDRGTTGGLQSLTPQPKGPKSLSKKLPFSSPGSKCSTVMRGADSVKEDGRL